MRKNLKDSKFWPFCCKKCAKVWSHIAPKKRSARTHITRTFQNAFCKHFRTHMRCDNAHMCAATQRLVTSDTNCPSPRRNRFLLCPCFHISTYLHMYSAVCNNRTAFIYFQEKSCLVSLVALSEQWIIDGNPCFRNWRFTIWQITWTGLSVKSTLHLLE